jgi:hypothetical protein
MTPAVADRAERVHNILADIQTEYLSDLLPYGVRLQLPDDGPPDNIPTVTYAKPSCAGT